MSALLWFLLALYVIGLIVTAASSLIALHVHSASSDYDRQARRSAAQWLLGSPVWPILAFRALLGVIATAKAALSEHEEAA